MRPRGFAHPILDRVRRTMIRHHMISPHTSLVVGVSGGPDSVALLHLLERLQAEFAFSLEACHLDHQLRAESTEEARFVADVCRKLAVGLTVKQVEVRALATKRKISIEEAGRDARYAFFEDVRRSAGAEVIATAHHRDDSLETFLLRVFRGSSLAGLGGIPPVRERIVRPLIDSTRAEILDFLHQEQIPYMTDPTNLKLDADRNFIRNRLLPVIAEHFPHFRSPLGRTVDLIGQDEDFLRRQSDALYSRTVREVTDGLRLDTEQLSAAAVAISSRVIIRALYALSGPRTRWSRRHVDAIIGIVKGTNPSARLDLPGKIYARREYDQLHLVTGPTDEKLFPFRYVVECPGTIEVPESDITLRFCLYPNLPERIADLDDRSRAIFDAHRVSFPIVVRSPAPGDRFRPWGMEGTRKLKEFLIDAKVPLRLRERTPLLVSNDEILWVVGHRRGSFAPVRKSTVQVLEISVEKGRVGTASSA